MNMKEKINEKMTTITVKEPKVEELLDKVEQVSVEEFKELQADLNRHKEELNELYNKKMEFNSNQRNDTQFSEKDLADAYMLAKARGVDVHSTELGSKMKAITSVAAFQAGFSNDVKRELEMELTVAPVFNQVSVNEKSFTYPVTAQGSERASVFPSGKFAVNPSDTTNVAVASQTSVSGVALTPHKFMRATWLARDEQEDTILALLPIQRHGAVSALARDFDRAVLRGDGSLTTYTATPTGNQSPFKGFSALASAVAGNGLNSWTGGINNKANTTSIATARSSMGKYGLETGKLVYFTSIEGYNSLVQDTNFLTLDKLGDKATLLTGQVGAIWGIPVKVTEYLDDVGANTNVIGSLVYAPGFAVASSRDVNIESSYNAALQIDNIYVSMRKDFKALTTESSAALSNSWSMASVITSTFA